MNNQPTPGRESLATSRPTRAAKGALLILCLFAAKSFAANILFIGNSFLFAYGSPVRFYRTDTVTDLNGEGLGGVPALFKSFTAQAGLSYEVYLETHPGTGIDWHLQNKLGVIGEKAWDTVVLAGYSTLDAAKPGDPALLISSAKQMAEFLAGRNAAVDVRLLATWPRADQTYQPRGHWYGKPIEAMAKDVRAGYTEAAAGTPIIKGVIPVGEAWVRAMQSGVADSNPYDGIDAGKLDLWTFDGYHASTYGYYLEALMVFGSVTKKDPRSLGDHECSGFELGLSPAQVTALEQVAFDQLAAAGAVMPSPPASSKPLEFTRCVRPP